jgi:flagellar secretion chaperone FliS
VPAYTASTPSDTYRQQSIMTASPGQLVVMLYDGALRFLLQAATAMRADDNLLADAKLRRAEAIIDELHATLDKERGGEIASRLEGIYVFCKRHLIEARIERDAGRIDKVSELLGELREAWATIAA